ncbi:MAG: phosphoglucosamine mutase [Acidobacteria bacterium]|nr:phosphoglucosamine mutase [Acidobacteriota bacterium]
MSRQLFGTDGIRGVAGKAPLDPRTVHATGAALGAWCRSHAPAGETPEVVVGMDTRESGSWIAEQVAGGLAREGVRARFAGVITTPGVAYLTKNDTFVAGVMISASHNPFQDNGIKIAGHSGYKLPDSEELEIEKVIFRLLTEGIEATRRVMEVEARLDARYLEYLLSTFPGRLDGMKIVLDCGNGAASRLGPEALERLGAHLVVTNAEPNGRNINLECGATHVDKLRARVVAERAAAGFAFDGDADRCIAVSASGAIVDGDAVLLMMARYLHARGRLHAKDGSPVVVATVMSNLGFQRALERDGIGLIRTAVGDKYVLEEMVKRGAPIGGEQSGHLIFMEQATTGDGLLTALRVLEVMQQTGKPLDELTEGFHSYPQKLVNLRVKERRPLADLVAVNAAIEAAEQSLGSDGRVLVRFSGTEPLLRVMVEGPTNESVENHCALIAGAIRSELGAS